MANTAKYDREQVVDKAMLLFWEKGFHGTSTRDLQRTINLRPGSFYAAFGSKEQLFKEALNRYSQQGRDLLQLNVAKSKSILGAVEGFIKALVLDQRDQVPSDMCMLVKTIAELTDEQSELVNESRMLLQSMESSMVDLLAQAKLREELKSDVDCEILAKKVIVQMMGLRTYLRSSNNEKLVEMLILEIFDSSRP